MITSWLWFRLQQQKCSFKSRDVIVPSFSALIRLLWANFHIWPSSFKKDSAKLGHSKEAMRTIWRMESNIHKYRLRIRLQEKGVKKDMIALFKNLKDAKQEGQFIFFLIPVCRTWNNRLIFQKGKFWLNDRNNL